MSRLAFSVATVSLLLAMCPQGVDAQQAQPAQQAPAGRVVAPEGPVPSAEAVERGNKIYSETCIICHGAGGRGGMIGAPDLTGSRIAMANDGGRELAKFLAIGSPDKGMPPRPVTEEEAAGLSAKLRSLGFAAAAATARPQAPSTIDQVLVGNAAAGEAYFNGPVGKCNTCHAVKEGATSPAANLAHIASKYPDPKTLQSNMVLMGRRFYWSPANSKDVRVTITHRDGRTEGGYLSSVSDFKVIYRDESGAETIVERKNGEPKVQLTDRLQHHLDLMRVYRDSDIHDLTAYLATLK